MRQHIKHIEKAVSTKEPRFMSRALRALVTLRKKLNSVVLRKAIYGYFPAASTTRPNNTLLDYFDEVWLREYVSIIEGGFTNDVKCYNWYCSFIS